MALTSLQTLSYLTANLAAARNPRFVGIYNPVEMPDADAGGVAMEGAMFAQVKVATRENPGFRTAYIHVVNFDAGATYTVTIDGNAVAYSGAPANVAALVQAIATAINADPSAGVIVTAAAFDYYGTGTVNTVRIIGKTAAGYTIDVAATGSAVVVAEADGENAAFSLFGRTQASVPSVVTAVSPAFSGTPWRSRVVGWALVADPGGTNGRAVYNVDENGLFFPKLACNGCSALYGYIGTTATGVSGDGTGVFQIVTVTILPCAAESTT